MRSSDLASWESGARTMTGRGWKCRNRPSKSRRSFRRKIRSPPIRKQGPAEFPATHAVMPPSGPSGDEEDSIENYMNRLLQRLRGAEPENVHAAPGRRSPTADYGSCLGGATCPARPVRRTWGTG